jgi:hypothetical protein
MDKNYHLLSRNRSDDVKKVLKHWPKVKKTGSGDSRFPAPPVILPLPSEEKKKEEDQVTS